MREAFVEALLSGNLEITKILLEAGAKVNIKDDKGFTPLMLAILLPSENPELLVELLLTAGAHVNIERNTWKQEGKRRKLETNTALTYAEELGNTKIIEMLKNAKQYRSPKAPSPKQ
jgi:FOG: Ankyrin repeat